MQSSGPRLVDLEMMSEQIRVVVCLGRDCMAGRPSRVAWVLLPHAVRSGSFEGVKQCVLAVVRALGLNSHTWRWHDRQRDRPR